MTDERTLYPYGACQTHIGVGEYDTHRRWFILKRKRLTAIACQNCEARI